ncbi:MAG: efflux RND transporter periplasmic adaptor subunit [Bacteroidales bacterium]
MIHTGMKYTVFIFTLALLVSACTEDDSEKDKNEDKAIPVMTAIARQESYQNELTFSGTVFAMREANLGSSMPGKVERFHYPRGSHVSKGDTLVSLSSEMLTQAKIEQQALEKDFQRIKRLYEKNSVSEMEYDHLKAKLDASRVKTRMLQKNTSVVAPFSGIIADYLIEEGENFFFTLNADPGYSHTSGILRLMQINPVKVEIQINEKQQDKIQKGQKVRITPDAFPDRSYTGVVHYIKPMLSTMTRATTVEIKVPNPGNRLKPGMYVRCMADAGQRDGIFVPMDAVFRQSGTPEEYVWLVKKDSVIRQQIRRIDTRGERIIVDSVADGDTVVVKGKNKLENGRKIKITQQ